MKNRKLVIAIIVAAILVITGAIFWRVFFTENKVPREFPTLPPKRVEKELQKAALQNVPLCAEPSEQLTSPPDKTV